jgi:hypothetical protein
MLQSYKQIGAVQHAVPVSVAESDSSQITLMPFTSSVGESAVYANVGGPVWALDWNTESSTTAYLAVSAHPSDALGVYPDHKYDSKYEGDNVIQIWTVPPINASTIQHGSPLTWKVGLRHDSGLVWALAWAKHREFYPDHRRTGLGILAACFADGRVAVYHIPDVPKGQILLDALAPMAESIPDDSVHFCLQWSLTNPFVFLTGSSHGTYN